MTDKDDHSAVLLRIAVGLERIASALEQHNAGVADLHRCPTCKGDGKGYGQQRCIRCGGTGLKQH